MMGMMGRLRALLHRTNVKTLAFLIQYAILMLGTLWTWFFRLPFGQDMWIYYDAGQRIRGGISPYLPFAMGYSFVYPPTGLLLAGPLGLFPPTVSVTGWSLLSVCCYLVSLWLILCTFGEGQRNWQSMFLLCSVWLLFNPWIETLRIGQVNAFLLFAVSLFLYLYNRQSPAWWTVLPLALAISIKISPVFFLIPLLRKRRWEHVMWIGVWGVMLVALTLFLFGINPWREYLMIFPRLSRGSLGPMSQTLEAVTFRFFPEISHAFRWTPLFCLVVVAAASRSSIARFDAYEAALILMGASMSSSLLWYHHIVFHLLPISVLLLSANGAGWRHWLTLLSVELVQIDRIVELSQFNWTFGLTAVLGYMFLFILLIAAYIERRLSLKSSLT